jgi:hypothetical protein
MESCRRKPLAEIKEAESDKYFILEAEANTPVCQREYYGDPWWAYRQDEMLTLPLDVLSLGG